MSFKRQEYNSDSSESEESGEYQDSRKPARSNEVSFTFRTEDEAGLLFAAGGATDYTRVYVSGGWCTRRDV